MRLFGFDISKSPVVTGGAPRFPQNDTAAFNGQAPVFQQPDFGGDITYQRVVTSDPRELWYLSLPSKLLPRQVEQIKRAGLGGDLWQQWQLESLCSDGWPMYRKCAHEVRQAVAGCKWIVRPHCETEGEGPKRSAVKKAALVRRSFASMRPDRFTDEAALRKMIYHLTDAILSGISVVELQWDNRDKEKLPRAASWVHPRHYTFNANGRIAIVGQQDIGKTLEWNSPRRNAGLALSDGDMRLKFLVSQFASRSGSALGGGLFRPLATWWSYWIFGREWISIMAQKHGTPFLKAKYKTGMVNQQEQSALMSRLQDAGANNYMLMPDTVELDVVAASALGADNPIVHLMRMADEAPQYLLLGQTATTQGTPGALGNDGSRADVKKANVQSLAEWVGTVLTEQWATAVLEANYGEGETDECPTIEPDFAEVSSPEKQAMRWTQLTGMNMPPVLKTEFYRENSLTEPKPGDEIVKGGKVTIAEEAKTEADQAQDQFERQVGQQVQMAEVQQGLQGGAQGGEDQQEAPAQASEPIFPRLSVKASRRGSVLTNALLKASPDELDELEVAVLEAEEAPHKNGEVEAVKAVVLGIAKKRKRFDV